MLGKHLTIPTIAACFAVILGGWRLVHGDEGTQRQRDEARFVLLEEHAEAIASAKNDIARRSAAADAFRTIVTDYFGARRIAPPPVGDQQAQLEFLRTAALLNALAAQAKQCKEENNRDACQRLNSLIGELREAFADGVQSLDEPAGGVESKEVEPNKEDAADDDSPAIQISEAERLLFKIVNAYRKKQSLPPLQLDENLCLAARDHSGDMRKHSFFSHVSPVPNRTQFTNRADLRGSTAHAENIARDCKDAEMAMRLWVNSQQHRANLTGSYTRIGVGIDKYGYYTQVFGK